MFPTRSRRLFPVVVFLVVPLLLIPLLLAPAAAAPDDLAPAYYSARTIIDSATVAAGTFNVLRVNCPTGMVALSGGVDVENVLSMVVSSSAPVYGDDRLLFVGDGAASAPTGWQATAINDAATVQDFRVGVLCVDASAGLSSVIGSDTAPVGSFGVERVLCPAGMISVGGGVDVGQVLTMRLSSTGPAFGADPLGGRLLSQTNGVGPAPVGWQASAINDGAANMTVKVAAVCAPEPVGALTVISSDTVSGGFGTERVVCPANMISVGGGIDLENVFTMDVSASGMTFTGATARLYQQSDGTQGPPFGWQGAARGSSGQLLRTGVICLPLYHSFIPTMLTSE